MTVQLEVLEGILCEHHIETTKEDTRLPATNKIRMEEIEYQYGMLVLLGLQFTVS